MLENRQIVYNSQLEIEALVFDGIQQKFPNHFHDYYVIGYIEKGSRKLSCKNKEYILKEGDFIFFNPYDNHECESIDGKPLIYRNLHIRPEIMEKHVHARLSLTKNPIFTVTVPETTQENQLFLQLHERLMNERANDAFEIEELFTLLLNDLLSTYSCLEESKHPTIPHKINETKEFIEENYAQKLSLAELSVFAETNQYTFIRLFTKYFGLTPFQYLITTRINQAKRLLKSDISITEIAMETGFSDQSHFTRVFKAQIGVTPKMYQKIFIA